MSVRSAEAQNLMLKISSILSRYDLIRYGLVGIVNTVIGFGIMAFLAWSGFHYMIYTAAGYIIAFISSYILNGLFTFRGSRLSQHVFLLFVTLNGTLLLAVEGFQILLIEYVGVPELLGVILGAAAYTLTGYVMNRKLVYRAG
jgi:putative flippase GtrA